MILLFTFGSLYTVQLWQIGPKKMTETKKSVKLI